MLFKTKVDKVDTDRLTRLALAIEEDNNEIKKLIKGKTGDADLSKEDMLKAINLLADKCRLQDAVITTMGTYLKPRRAKL